MATRKVLYDTSVYIDALRRGDPSRLLTRGDRGEVLWLSAVVLEELYAGSDEPTAKLLSRCERDFGRARRLVVPQQSDWAATGRLLARIGEKYGYEIIGRSRLTNDALIATSASRGGIVVLTINARDFDLIAEFLPSFEWEAI